jgi:hypothetical protein
MGVITRFFTKDQYKNLFLLSWLLLGLFQAGFTELMDDEAYYWVYSQHLDWGYFDHPPMVALLIKLGYSLFHNELGVRLLMVILNVLSLWLTWKLIPRKHNKLFYLVLCSMGAMQVGGMLAVPDVPLIFFATLYFYLYREFLEKQNWKHTLLLSLGMALLFYSKYHGILLVLFTVISNVNLLRVFKFYVACFITAILFFPHLYWQYAHGFPSLQYHLVERNASAYDISFTLDYIFGQILLFGPLIGWLLLYFAFRCPIQNTFERALKACLIGVMSFFLLSTFKGRVEANWTVMLFTPVVILAHQAFIRKGWSVKWLLYTVPPTLLIVLIVRVYMVWDFLPNVEIRPEIHHNREWAKEMEQKAGNNPLIFLNSYQLASKYMFYSGHESYSINNRYARRSQFNYWHMEEPLWGKAVWVAYENKGELPVTDSVSTVRGKWYLHLENPYYSYSLIQLIPALTTVKAKPGESVSVNVRLQNNYNQPVPFDTSRPAILGYGIIGKDGNLPEVKTALTLEKAIQRGIIRMVVIAPKEAGTYQLKFCVFAGDLPPTHNSPTIKLIISE